MTITQLFAKSGLTFQTGHTTCGPVTLLNVLHLKGDFSQTEDLLAKLCQTSLTTGTSHEHMLAAAKQLGLDVVKTGRDATLEELEKLIDDGYFVIINYFHAFAEDGHYGLVCEYDEAAFYLRDCSLGMLRLRREYVRKFWHNREGKVYGWFMAIA